MRGEDRAKRTLVPGRGAKAGGGGWPLRRRRRRGRLAWSLAALAAVLLIAAALRLGTNASRLGPTWDEIYLEPVVRAILHRGWTVATLIDYDDTKGPVFFWLYAALAEIFGAGLQALRLMTLAFYALTVWPLVRIARLCGVFGPRLVRVALLYATLPYLPVLGQLFMSEPSFLLGMVLLAYAFVRCFAERVRGTSEAAEASKAAPQWSQPPHRPDLFTRHAWLGPTIFGVGLAVMLHHRIHAVAFAGAVCLVAFQRDRWRSWPWWVASFLAGLSRLPLYVRWGGFVGPSFQDRYGLGLRLDSLTYLAIALLPLLFTFLVQMLRERTDHRPRAAWLWGGVIAGLVLAAFAPPSAEAAPTESRYLGMVMSALRPLTGTPGLFRAAITLLCPLGTAALAAVLYEAWRESARRDAASVTLRLSSWAILLGWLLYGLTRGDVYDRYLVAFAFLWPIVCVKRLSTPLLALQLLGQAAIAVVHAYLYLIRA